MAHFQSDPNQTTNDKLDEMIGLQKQLLAFFVDMQAKHEDRPSLVDVSGHEVRSDPVSQGEPDAPDAKQPHEGGSEV